MATIRHAPQARLRHCSRRKTAEPPLRTGGLFASEPQSSRSLLLRLTADHSSITLRQAIPGPGESSPGSRYQNNSGAKPGNEQEAEAEAGDASAEGAVSASGTPAAGAGAAGGEVGGEGELEPEPRRGLEFREGQDGNGLPGSSGPGSAWGVPPSASAAGPPWARGAVGALGANPGGPMGTSPLNGGIISQGQPGGDVTGGGTSGTAPSIVNASNTSNANANSQRNSSSISSTNSSLASPSAGSGANSSARDLELPQGQAQGVPGESTKRASAGMPGSSMFVDLEPGKAGPGYTGASPQVGGSQGATGDGSLSTSASASATASSASASAIGSGSASATPTSPPPVSSMPQARPAWGSSEGGPPRGGPNGGWTGQPMPGGFQSASWPPDGVSRGVEGGVPEANGSNGSSNGGNGSNEANGGNGGTGANSANGANSTVGGNGTQKVPGWVGIGSGRPGAGPGMPPGMGQGMPQGMPPGMSQGMPQGIPQGMGMGMGMGQGMGMGLRGRSSVLGSATMQGSRFEPGHGDTSWINSMSPDWFPVIPLWQATADAALASEPFLTHMSQGWRVLLLSDGSVTRHLHLLTGHRVSVDCLEMRAIGHSLLGVPPGTALVAGPRVQRQVLLKTAEGVPLAYAASWWAEYEARMHLSEAHTPIWVALQQQRMELFRSLECLYYGHSREIERLFGRSGPFWARHYLFYHNGRPLTLIYEVFSPNLDEWLGDSALPEDLYLP